MLSQLPKLLDKAFVLGFFFPAMLLVLALGGIFFDQPWASAFFAAAANDKEGWEKFAYFILATWVLSILLMTLNRVEFQILEGYRWPLSKCNWLKKRETARFERVHPEFRTLNDEWTRLAALNQALPADQKTRWEELRKWLVKRFPLDRKDHLPTRLGNATRAFETYSAKVYGADSIPLWLHLSAVVPKDFQEGLADARSQVDCAMNISVLSAVAGVIAAARFLWALQWSAALAATNSYHKVVALFAWPSVLFLIAAAVAFLLSRLVYLFAVELIYSWGELVKASFDLYLPELAKKLGYELPDTADRRKVFWKAVSEQAIYWHRLMPEDWKVHHPQPTDEEEKIKEQLKKVGAVLSHLK